jgi:hypothetical protein
VEVLELKYKSLLSKWLYKLLNEEGMRQDLLRNKYLRTKTLSQVSANPTDSPFCKGLMRVKDDFFTRGSSVVRDGQTNRVWEDTCLGHKPLKDQYPTLYNIVNHPNMTVAHVMGSTPQNIGFR